MITLSELFFSFALISTTVAPICRPGQVQTYNVGRGEAAQIHCEVEGIPRDINFVWKFNTSVSEVLDMPSSFVRNNATQSVLHFKPMTEHVIPAFPLFSCNFFVNNGVAAERALFPLPRLHNHYALWSLTMKVLGQMSKSSFRVASNFRIFIQRVADSTSTKEASSGRKAKKGEFRVSLFELSSFAFSVLHVVFYYFWSKQCKIGKAWKWEQILLSCKLRALYVLSSFPLIEQEIFSIIAGLWDAFVLGRQRDGNANWALCVQYNTSR
jgi:hypothetical protein